MANSEARPRANIRRARGTTRAAVCVSLVVVFAGGARAIDNPLSIEFGPAGGGPAAASVDRQFIKDWEGNPAAGYPTLSPANVDATKAAIKRYSEIVANGGWKTVPDVEVKPGETHFAVTVLRDRLLASGDLTDGPSNSEVLDASLVEVVKRFQTLNGLTPTGIVDERTIAALNVAAEARLRQLKTNLSRLSEMSAVVRSNKKYVVVNIPAAQVEAVALNRVISRHAGVVGKPDRPTPLLRSTIVQMNFNPVWRLPPTVIDKDLIPRGREMQAAGKNVLVKFGIDAYDGSGKKVDPGKVDWNSAQPRSLSFSQQPGKDNPLGFLKINFASGESVYMHDSPSESLFGRNFRAASSGCIRVHNIEKLAYWLLGQNDGWDEARIEEIKASGKRLDVKLVTPVPLYFVYITAWATEDGVVQFRRDLYNRQTCGSAPPASCLDSAA
jgi:murein L,D-transpeptidase YcbB/YkuD